MTGISSQVLRRAVISLDRNAFRLASRARVLAVRLSPTLQLRPMFGRALDQAAAGNPPSRMPANKTPLAKQLFLSSPSPAPTKIAENNTLATMFARRRAPAGSSGPSRTASTHEPLQTRPVNVSQPPPRSTNNSSLASLLNKSNSFREEPEVIDLMDDSPRPTRSSRTNNMASSVYLSIDDFSDDENLDLDFQAPSALPTLPRPQLPSTTQNHNEPPPASDTSVLSWSQSSPSHHQPPRPSMLPPQKTAKRASRDNDEPALPTTKKFKRELPKRWNRPSAPEDEDFEELYATATPAPKPKDPMLWNTTASAVKAQKKQLKTQLKGSGKAEASLEDMQEAVKSHTAKAKAAAITLSNEQRHVKSLVVEKGQSVFFTGPAGTGKSVLMRAIIQELKKKHVRDPERVAVTASTGLAACNIGGMTLHSFSGIGLGKEDANTLVKKIRRNPKAKNRWLKTKTLIIDEVSMVDADLFDKLSQIGRTIRNNGRPWGGIQLVITGDFFQLPPVPDAKQESKFAFDAATWSLSIEHTIGLTEVFRQKDPEFADMLNEMRLGLISDNTVRSFQALSRPLRFNDGLEVTELFPTRYEVDNANQKRLRALTGKSYRFESLDTGDIKIRDKLLSNMMAPPALELKKGAQVMLIKNMDETLVNGSLGTVMGFMTEATFEIKGGGDESDGETDAKKRVRAFTNALSEKADNKEYPVVRFHAVDGTFRVLLCVPEDWKVELPTGEVQASRKQLPLILAWALSIHKAQGQTLERVKVDLGKVFEKGQAYVALSRATTQEGLQVLNFQKARVMAHARVVQFYNKLYSAEAAVKKKAAGSITSYVKKEAPPGAPARQQHDDLFDEDEEEAMAAYG